MFANRATEGRRVPRRRNTSARVETLEGRALLATLSFQAAVPTQKTDFSAPVSLPRFDPALGTLNRVDVTLAASATTSGTARNNAANPQTFTMTDDVEVDLTDASGTTTLLAPHLVSTRSFEGLATEQSVVFGPFNPTASASASYTSGADFARFAGGPGSVPLAVTTLSSESIRGGGGNVLATFDTVAGAVVTVVYDYTPAPVSIAGTVYHDAQGTGALASGDPRLGGVTLTLLDGLGRVVATTTTAADGTYAFVADSAGQPLQAGTYSVVESQPAGFAQGSNTVGTVAGSPVGALGATDTIARIVLTAGQASVGNNFGEVLPVVTPPPPATAALSGHVYVDANDDGRRGPGEAPIGGVTITLTGTDNLGHPVLLTTTTAADGSYSFPNLAPGTYRLVETQPAAYLDGGTTAGSVGGVAGDDVIGSIVLAPGASGRNYDFGEVVPSSIDGSVYLDTNRDATRNPGEFGIAHVPITLTGTDDRGRPVSITVTTDPDGSFTFPGLRPGTYRVQADRPSNFRPGHIGIGTAGGTSGPNSVGAITLTPGLSSHANLFGVTQAPGCKLGCISTHALASRPAARLAFGSTLGPMPSIRYWLPTLASRLGRAPVMTLAHHHR